MALLNCPECGGQVSDKAGGCPHPGASMRRLHLFWLPAMLAAWGIHALVPLHIGRLWFDLPWVLAPVFGVLTLLAHIGAHSSLVEDTSDIAWLNDALRWMQPLCALLAALLLALAVDLLVNGLRGPSAEREVVLRRDYCTSHGTRIKTTTRMAQKNGKWCFDTGGLSSANARIPVAKIQRPVPLGETVNARWRSYRSIFGVADAYYQITDIH